MLFKASNHIRLTLNALIATKVVCFSRLVKCLRSLYGKQSGSRSDCSYRSSLFWVHAVCLYTLFISYVRQLFAADDFSRRHFQMYFFLGALRVNICKLNKWLIIFIDWLCACWEIFHDFLSSAVVVVFFFIFLINLFKKFFQEYYQSVKHLGTPN